MRRQIRETLTEGCFGCSYLGLGAIGAYYRSACNAVHPQKWPETEQHLRKAVEQNPEYAAAWATLGQARSQ
jgi:hypothetical protein